MIDRNSNFFKYFNYCNCYWCQENDWPVLWKIDDSHETFYWFEIPKNASSTIKDFYGKNSSISFEHIRRNETYHQLNDSIKPIVVYDDPIDRFITLVNDYFSCGNWHNIYGRYILADLGLIDVHDKDLEKFSPHEKLKIIFSNIKNLTDREQVHHFYPQKFFVDDLKFKDFELVYKKNINERFGINKSIWINKSKKHILKEHLVPEQIKLLVDIYEEDYKFISKFI